MSKSLRLENVPAPTIRRLPTYLNCLLDLQAKGVERISSAVIAEILGLTGIQVRKDLAWVSDSGKPRTGFPVDGLVEDIKYFLGYNRNRRAILVGVGHLGGAFLNYKGFIEYGLAISDAFDVDPKIINSKRKSTIPVHDISEMENMELPEMAILAVPQEKAQGVAEYLVKCGIKAIWNFSATYLSLPGDIIVENVDLAQSLALLWNKFEINRITK